MQEKILVTGSAGFVGKHLVKRLAKIGDKPLMLDKDLEVKLQGGEQLDVRSDFNRIVTLLEKTDTVYHLANVARIGPSWNKYKEYYETNLSATQSMLHMAQVCGVKNFVYLSSSSVYGNNGSSRQKEDDRLCPTNPYAISKMAAEYALLAQATKGKTRLVIARPFNMYGDDMAKGQNAMAISKFFEAKRTNQSLQIHGDGTQRRDMLHIDDAIDAFLLLNEKGQANEIYNVGSGSNISIKELADIISTDQTHVPPRSGIEYDTLADISKIQSLGFKVRTDVRSWIKEKLTSGSF